MGNLDDEMASLTDDMTDVREALETDLENVLDHPCRTSLERIDPETGEVVLQVELDLAVLRERLKEYGDYDDLRIGINGDLVVEIASEF